MLAHPTRIHVIEELAGEEKPVSDLLKATGVEPANLSQHLSVLRGRGLVLTRKKGNQVFYRLRDTMLVEVLESMRRHFVSHLEESLALLNTLESDR